MLGIVLHNLKKVGVQIILLTTTLAVDIVNIGHVSLLLLLNKWVLTLA